MDDSQAPGVFGALLAFVFRTAENPDGMTEGVVFATTCALAFFVFVLIDLLRFLVGKMRLAPGGGTVLNIRHGWRSTALYLVLGSVAAWLVGLVAYIMDVFQPDPVPAIAVGVTWEFVFDRLVKQLKRRAREATEEDDEPVQDESEEQ